jgi:hypothetical protein
MTLIRCDNHGRQGFIEVCEHINSELSSNLFCEHKLLKFWGNVYACDACWQSFNFDKFENHPELNGKDFWGIDDEFDENSLAFKDYYNIYSQLKRNCWCVKCVNEIRANTISKTPLFDTKQSARQFYSVTIP